MLKKHNTKLKDRCFKKVIFIWIFCILLSGCSRQNNQTQNADTKLQGTSVEISPDASEINNDSDGLQVQNISNNSNFDGLQVQNVSNNCNPDDDKIPGKEENVSECISNPSAAPISSSTSGESILNFSELYGYNNSSGNTNDEKAEKFNKEYLQYLTPSDDGYDFRWANDYARSDIAKLINTMDSGCYEEVFGFKKPTLSDLEHAIRKSSGIAEKFKEHIIDFVRDWLSYYPDTDFSVLLQNLGTLKVIEVNSNQMMWAALSPNAVACYRPNENEIYVNENIDLSDRYSDDIIVFRHEFIHASRTTKTKVNKYTVTARTYPGSNMGLYYDEAVMTNFLYEIQGLNRKSQYYRMASNYYRIIMDCLGDSFSGADYFNHSINYFAFKMDEYMGDSNYALHILSLIDVQMNKHYGKYLSFELNDFSELYEYITKMYMKKYLKSDMTEKEKEQVFRNFMSELTASLDKAQDKYEGIEESSFRPYFIECSMG